VAADPTSGNRAGARPPAAAGALTVAALPTLERAREPWRELAEQSRNIFSTWEWADVWWRHFGAGALALATVSAGGRTVGLLPLYRARLHGVPVVRFVGHGAADQLGIVCDPGEDLTAAAAMRSLLRGGEVMLAERVSGGATWAAAVGGRLLSEESSPIIDLAQEGGWEGYLGARSSNFRQQVRRRGRRLERGLGIRFRLADDPGRLAGDLRALLLLHDRRWGEESRAFRTREAFHVEFASRALEAGWLRLWMAEADGTPVAAWYGFRFAGVESYYQAGRDRSWDRYSIGAGILEHSIREAFADGMREYRLLRGGELYKRRYETREAGVCTVAAGRSPWGRATVATVAALARSERGMRMLRPLRGRAIGS
jgi:CelD/BcsL family acetyltransferase involved in cellulose biosynthesis